MHKLFNSTIARSIMTQPKVVREFANGITEFDAPVSDFNFASDCSSIICPQSGRSLVVYYKFAKSQESAKQFMQFVKNFLVHTFEKHSEEMEVYERDLIYAIVFCDKDVKKDVPAIHTSKMLLGQTIKEDGKDVSKILPGNFYFFWANYTRWDEMPTCYVKSLCRALAANEYDSRVINLYNALLQLTGRRPGRIIKATSFIDDEQSLNTWDISGLALPREFNPQERKAKVKVKAVSDKEGRPISINRDKISKNMKIELGKKENPKLKIDGLSGVQSIRSSVNFSEIFGTNLAGADKLLERARLVRGLIDAGEPSPAVQEFLGISRLDVKQYLAIADKAEEVANEK